MTKHNQPSITNINEALDFISVTAWKGSSLGLSRITELLQLMGNPHKKLKFVHIAGTNGKGSTAAMLASVLSEAGYKTGLHTSPYIHSFGEYMQINGISISDSQVIDLANELREYLSKMQDLPTQFEIIIALAFLHFYRQQCDIVVLEVGMGGRLDATNVIDTPEVAVITSIGLDHMEELGDTYDKIASEKAGIIKYGGVAVCHPQMPSVEQVIRSKCDGQCTQVCFIDSDDIKLNSFNLEGQFFSYKDAEEILIPLLGQHQLYNAAVAMETVYALRRKKWHISDDALKNGLKKTKWPGRFEILMKSPIFILDGAHNPQSIQTILNNLILLFPNRKFIFLFGVLEDKDYKQMTEILLPHASLFLTIAPENPRALSSENLASHIKNYNVDAIACKTIEKGVEKALETADKDDIICALGSLYLVGSIRSRLLRPNN